MTPEIKKRIDQIRHGIVPEGYCKTPLDITPEEWKHTTISKICKLSSGSTPRRDKSDNFIGDILWVSSGELKCRVLSDTLEHISENAADASHLKMYSPGTVVIAIYGLEAEGVRGTASILGTKCTISQACMAFTDFQNVNNEYLYYWYLLHGNVIGLRYAQGTKQQNLSSDIIDALPISLPDIDTQVRIAAILTTQDKVIALKEQLLAQKLEQKKYLMQQLLTGKKRLPGFDGEWTRGTLRDLCVLNPKPDKLKDEDVAFLGMTDVNEYGQIITQRTVKFDSVKTGFTYFRRGDLLVAKITPCFENGKGADTNHLSTEFGVGSTEFHVLRVSDNVSRDFVFYHINSPTFRKKLESEMTGSAGQKRIQGISILKYKLLIPVKEEQVAIVNVLSTADKELDLLRQSIEQEKQKKKALMQLLLTGIVRV